MADNHGLSEWNSTPQADNQGLSVLEELMRNRFSQFADNHGLSELILYFSKNTDNQGLSEVQFVFSKLTIMGSV